MSKDIYDIEDLKKTIEIRNNEIPNAFWKYFDLFRREKLSLSDFSIKSGLSEDILLKFLSTL